MNILKNTLRTCTNALTLGGAAKLLAEKKKYDEIHKKHSALHSKVQNNQLSIKKAFDDIGELFMLANQSLQQADSILKRSETHLPNALTESVDFSQIYKKLKGFNSDFKIAMNIGYGGVAGGVTGLGAWAMVSLLGTASTGTAITGLSGVAATNATLAWFGGGAIAAGGAGMAAGTLVLGGIVLVPLIYLAAKKSYKDAEEYKVKTPELEADYIKLKTSYDETKAVLANVTVTKKEIEILVNTFIEDVEKAIEDIQPETIFTEFSNHISRIFEEEQYKKNKEKQLMAISRLAETVDTFLNAFTNIKPQ